MVGHAAKTVSARVYLDFHYGRDVVKILNYPAYNFPLKLNHNDVYICLICSILYTGHCKVNGIAGNGTARGSCDKGLLCLADGKCMGML